MNPTQQEIRDMDEALLLLGYAGEEIRRRGMINFVRLMKTLPRSEEKNMWYNTMRIIDHVYEGVELKHAKKDEKVRGGRYRGKWFSQCLLMTSYLRDYLSAYGEGRLKGQTLRLMDYVRWAILPPYAHVLKDREEATALSRLATD